MQHFNLALRFYGVKEIENGSHPFIEKCLKSVGLVGFDDSEQSWCSGFVNLICKQSGMEHTDKPNARSWEKVGIETFSPQIGDIVVLWRESPESWKGHVGFYVNMDKEYVYILGGNQRDAVNISAYPKERILTVRII